MNTAKRISIPSPEGPQAGQELHLDQRDALAAELNNLVAERDALSRQLVETRERLEQTQQVLATIYASHGWKLLVGYRRLLDGLLPSGSRRRAAVRALCKAALRLYRAAAGLHAKQRLRYPNDAYALWIELNEPKPLDLERQRHTRFTVQPKISLLAAVDDTAARFLKSLLRSVRDQTYGNWELCLAAGDGPDANFLRQTSHEDPRIKTCFSSTYPGNTGAALALATGDYVALLGPHATLAPFALFEVVRALQHQTDIDLLYSDEDTIDETSEQRQHPHFKPDWSPDTLRSHNYLGHLAVLRRELIRQVGGFRPGFARAADYDLLLRVSEQARGIVHIPKVLYHGRGPVPLAVEPTENESARKALQEHLDRCGCGGAVADGLHPGTYQVRYPLGSRPLISVVIPNRDQPALLARCLQSLTRSHYDSHEVFIVENHSEQLATFAYYRQLEQQKYIRTLTWTRPFNYAALNNWAVTQTHGEVLLFLNNDVEAINPDWLERLLEHALRPEVGAVGAKLYYPDDTVQHAGVILGVGGVAGHAHRYFPRSSSGYARRLAVVQDLSAVTGACLMIRKQLFEDMGGFDERFVLIYNDVDLCLRLRQKGYRIIWTPHAELYHHESTTRGSDEATAQRARVAGEVEALRSKWDDVLRAGDPYYSPNLTLQWEDFSLRL